MEIQVAVDVAAEAPLAGAHIDAPRPGSVDAVGGAMDFAGWVVGEGVKAVEVREDRELIRTTPVDVKRPDVAAVFPDHPEAIRSGFLTTVELAGTAPEFNLEVWVSFDAGDRVMIATVHGRHCWRRQATPAFAELASVVIFCRDEAGALTETIESALAQTYPHLELVLIDGSRDDRPREIADEYEGVRVFAQEVPERDPYAEGICHTNGDFLVFADAGDRLLPHALATGIGLLEGHRDWAFTRGRCRAISSDGSPIPLMLEVRQESDPYEELLRGTRAEPACAAIYRRAVFEDVEGFDPSLGRARNLDLDLRISSCYAAGLHDEVVTEQRLDVDDARRVKRSGLAALVRQRKLARRTGRGDAYRNGRKAWRRSWNGAIAQQRGRPRRRQRLTRNSR